MSGLTSTSYTVTGLIPGNSYRFIVEAHNMFGYGPASNSITIIAATNPETP